MTKNCSISLPKMAKVEPKNYVSDVLVIGSGPAGMSAGIWCSDLGLSVVVLEKETQSGGQLLSIFNPVNNYLGVVSANGRELRDRFLVNVDIAGTPPILGATIVDLDAANGTAFDEAGNQYSANHFILATGVRRRKLGVDGEDRLVDKGILRSGSLEKESVAGKTVAIIGGGDAALENAVILAEFAEKIYVVHRRDSFSARESFTVRADADPKVEFLLETAVTAISGDDRVSSIVIQNRGESTVVDVDAVLVRIGVEPNSDLLLGKTDLDKRGYVLVDTNGQTSLPNVYAVGDVANPISPTIATAVGGGAAAAKSIYRRMHAGQ